VDPKSLILYKKEEDEDEGDDELDPDYEDVAGRHATCVCQSVPNFRWNIVQHPHNPRKCFAWAKIHDQHYSLITRVRYFNREVWEDGTTLRDPKIQPLWHTFLYHLTRNYHICALHFVFSFAFFYLPLFKPLLFAVDVLYFFHSIQLRAEPKSIWQEHELKVQNICNALYCNSQIF
jgi:hypothetical protein